MTTITKEEYGTRLAGFISEQMVLLPTGRKNLKFWIEFNRAKKVEFDEILAAEGTVVET